MYYRDYYERATAGRLYIPLRRATTASRPYNQVRGLIYYVARTFYS